MKPSKLEVSNVKCDLCSYIWIAIRPENIERLECPNCRNLALFENIENINPILVSNLDILIEYFNQQIENCKYSGIEAFEDAIRICENMRKKYINPSPPEN